MGASDTAAGTRNIDCNPGNEYVGFTDNCRPSNTNQPCGWKNDN